MLTRCRRSATDSRRTPMQMILRSSLKSMRSLIFVPAIVSHPQQSHSRQHFENLFFVSSILQSFEFLSTGGTQEFIEKLGYTVTPVEKLTGFPSIFGGRVKTLHPAVFGGILYRRDDEGDLKQAKEFNIGPIDLVIVDLYPFEETVSKGGSEEDIIEKIDIGGIALIRGAAKNFNDVLITASRNQYSELLTLLQTKNCSTDLQDRKKFAAMAFDVTSHYDSAIFSYFNNEFKIP